MKIGSFAPYRLPKLDEKCIPGMISNCDLLFKLFLIKYVSQNRMFYLKGASFIQLKINMFALFPRKEGA